MQKHSIMTYHSVVLSNFPRLVNVNLEKESCFLFWHVPQDATENNAFTKNNT